MSHLVDILEVIKSLAVKAGKSVLEIYEKDFQVEYKDDNSPLTDADKISNDIIISGLEKEFYNYAILSEESKDDLSRLDNKYCWIVDPLDGTKEFIKKNGEFTINIALTYNHRVILGVIYAPVREELYYASKGNGAFLYKNGEVIKLKVSDRINNIRIVASRSHLSDKLKSLLNEKGIKNIVYIGSSLKGCLVAKGDAEVYYRFNPTMEWDTAAMQCIVEEAGGIFRQMDDTEMIYNRKNNVNEKGFYILNRSENKLLSGV